MICQKYQFQVPSCNRVQVVLQKTKLLEENLFFSGLSLQSYKKSGFIGILSKVSAFDAIGDMYRPCKGQVSNCLSMEVANFSNKANTWVKTSILKFALKVWNYFFINHIMSY